MLQAKEFLKDQKVTHAYGLITEPLISVILPTYCRGDNGFLARAIDSVLAQSFRSFELIIVDDGSVDATQSVVRNYLEKDNRIVYVRNDVNCGLPALRVNQGLLLARGKYIAYQFDDDQWTQNALEVLLEELKKQEEPALVYGKCHILTETQDGHIGTNFNYGRLVRDNFIANNSVLHSRELFEHYGMYDSHLVMRRLCDWDLWVRWAKEAPFVYLNKEVSIVTAEVEGSLGRTVTLRFDSARKRMACPRNLALTPKRFPDYDMENLNYLLDPIERESIFNEFVWPWKQLHKAGAPCGEGHPIQRIICTKLEYDSSVAIMLENFIQALPENYEFVYIPDTQLMYEDFSDGDIFVIARSINDGVLQIVKKLKQCGRNVPTIFYMDDNLFQYYRVDPDAAYLAPGSAGYETLKELVQECDLVVTFNESISEEVRTLNPRVITAKTNIPSRYLAPVMEAQAEGPIRIAFMGGGARKEEFKEIENDLVLLSKEYGSNIEFYFYGYLPEAMKTLRTSTVKFIPFTDAYYHYLRQLQNRRFDLVLCPLYDGAFKRCKSPIKLLEATCCGAVGVYSDVSVYDCIQDGVTGYKIKWGERWLDRLRALVEAGRKPLKLVFANAHRLVMEEYSTESQLEFYHYIFQTAKLNFYLKDATILYACHSCYCAGAESLLLRHALLAKRSGVSVLFALPSGARGIEGELLEMLDEAGIEIVYLPYTNYTELVHCDYTLAIEQGEQIAQLLDQRKIGLIHNCTLMPALSYAAQLLKVPQVTSVYQGLDAQGYELRERSFAPTVIHSDSVKEAALWINKYHAYGMCIGNVIPDEFFRVEPDENPDVVRVASIGTFQPRKNQLGAVKAATLVLKHFDAQFYFYGYSKFYPEYFSSCKQEVLDNGLSERIKFPGFVDAIISSFTQDRINIFLCASKEESIPQSMREAMAMGIPVVSTPVGNVPELVVDGVTGYLARGFEPEDIAAALERCIADIRSGEVRTVTANAKKQILKNCSELTVARQLFYLYSQAFTIKEKELPCQIAPEQAEALQKAHPLPELPVVQTTPLLWRDMVFSKAIQECRRYRIICDRNRIERIGVVFATEEGNITGGVRMRLLYKGICIRECSRAMGTVRLGGWTYFEISPLDWCGGKELIVELMMDYGEQSGRLGVYENQKNRSLIYRILKKLGFAPQGRNTLWFSVQ